MLEKVKDSMRVSTSLVDDEVKGLIASARAELIRLGIKEEKANSEDDPLIVQAIITFCKGRYTYNDADAVRFENSWKYQVDNLRKTKSYVED